MQANQTRQGWERINITLTTEIKRKAWRCQMICLSWYKQSVEEQRWEVNPEPLAQQTASSEIPCGQENGNFIKIQLLPVSSDTLKQVT